VKPEMRGTIFERFRQAQSGNTREFGGTGLGLAIAKDFADLHGGSIALTDAPGGGALFQVEVPRYAPESACVRAPEMITAIRVFPGIAEELQEALPEEFAGEDLMIENRAAGRPRVLVVEETPRCAGSSAACSAMSTTSCRQPMANRLWQERLLKHLNL
jgi:hypothetical protein